MEKENRISFLLTGPYALFSDPVTRVGGEKCTYPIPTFEALQGVCESILWKPTILWRVTRFRVMNRIMTQFKGIRTVDYSGGGQGGLSGYTYLKDVAYQVEAHFVWNMAHPELAGDRNENKYFFMAKRALERGGRRDIFLGVRECQGYVEPCAFGEDASYYDGHEPVFFGPMFHTFDREEVGEKGTLRARFWPAQMETGGFVVSPAPGALASREVKNYTTRKWMPGADLTPVEQEAEKQ